MPDSRQDLARSRWQDVPNEREVLLHRMPIPCGVLHDHHEPDRTLVPVGEELALPGIPAVLVLEVEDEAIDLHSEDLGRPEEAGVHRFSVLAGGYLERRSPGLVRLFRDVAGNRDLSRIAKRCPSTRVDPHNDVESDGFPD